MFMYRILWLAYPDVHSSRRCDLSPVLFFRQAVGIMGASRNLGLTLNHVRADGVCISLSTAFHGLRWFLWYRRGLSVPYVREDVRQLARQSDRGTTGLDSRWVLLVRRGGLRRIPAQLPELATTRRS